jgi:hypothetical protein
MSRRIDESRPERFGKILTLRRLGLLDGNSEPCRHLGRETEQVAPEPEH